MRWVAFTLASSVVEVRSRSRTLLYVAAAHARIRIKVRSRITAVKLAVIAYTFATFIVEERLVWRASMS